MTSHVYARHLLSNTWCHKYLQNHLSAARLILGCGVAHIRVRRGLYEGTAWLIKGAAWLILGCGVAHTVGRRLGVRQT